MNCRKMHQSGDDGENARVISVHPVVILDTLPTTPATLAHITTAAPTTVTTLVVAEDFYSPRPEFS